MIVVLFISAFGLFVGSTIYGIIDFLDGCEKKNDPRSFHIILLSVIGLCVTLNLVAYMDEAEKRTTRLLEQGYKKYDSKTGDLIWTDPELKYIFTGKGTPENNEQKN